ncbi:hypothetical protein [Roseibacillus ishigakijimensis]|uniref:Uncharacterized protein n=1 Tax=Roseibacillus ishigakijimensis TaxID=454146 RepID=A0A934RW73_9BACT|nr:hypothetical protein [Roseibacillus ishigakijimensis]MBK1835275.1 hypothetical protein [Roseibacillus ishigakijimensis]
MSDFMDGMRSPGAIGVILGIVVLAGFGGLSTMVFDDRFNGDAAARLKAEIQEQKIEILTLENDIEVAERRIAQQQENEGVARELAVVEKSLQPLEERQKELAKAIEEEKVRIEEIGEELLSYRDEYRIYERKRAIGEIFDEIVLTTGKKLQQAEIKEIFADKIRFTTQFGSSSATWKELPESWRDRFQIGEGELEAHREMMTQSREQRAEKMVALRKERNASLRKMELKKSLERINRDLEASRVEMEKARANVAILKSKAGSLRNRAQDARIRGSVSTHSNEADKAEASAERLSAGVRLAQNKIKELEKEKARLERVLRDL